jgi:hypothetical protein
MTPRFNSLALVVLVAVTGTTLRLFPGALPQPFLARTPEASAYSSSPPSSDKTRQQGIEDEEYAVYSALINASLNDENRNRPLVIEETPSPWIGFIDEERASFYDDLKKSSPALLAETVDDLQAKNKESHKFERRFDIGRPYLLISEKELEDIFQEGGGGGWDEFFQKYPQARGFATFSRVGFNQEKTQALVYQAHSCGGLCGGGSYVLLVKSNGVWTSKGSIGPVWVS